MGLLNMQHACWLYTISTQNWERYFRLAVNSLRCVRILDSIYNITFFLHFKCRLINFSLSFHMIQSLSFKCSRATTMRKPKHRFWYLAIAQSSHWRAAHCCIMHSDEEKNVTSTQRNLIIPTQTRRKWNYPVRRRRRRGKQIKLRQRRLARDVNCAFTSTQYKTIVNLSRKKNEYKTIFFSCFCCVLSAFGLHVAHSTADKQWNESI